MKAIEEMPRWSEYAKGDELRVGEIYFRIAYVDTALLVPFLEPVVFLGNDFHEDDEGMAYFQDAASYADGVRPLASDGGAADPESYTLHCVDERDGFVFVLEKALDELTRCLHRRRGLEKQE